MRRSSPFTFFLRGLLAGVLALAVVLFAAVGGCSHEPIVLGPEDRGPIDRSTINLVIFDNASGVVEQIPQVSPASK